MGGKPIKNIILSIIMFVLLVSGLIVYIILSLVDGDDGMYTTIQDDPSPTVDSYLSSHPWSNVTSLADIKNTLNFDLLKSSKRQLLEECPGVPFNLNGPVPVHRNVYDFKTLEIMHAEMHGRFEPKTCRSKQKVAIIVPYRNRENHLRVLLHNLIPFLQRQLLDFTIVVVNQALPSKFNRAMLFNIGFLEASSIHPFDCFIFHDVDLLPLDDRHLYDCGRYPRHMSIAIDKFHFRNIGKEAFGGVVSFSREAYLRINGASNLFFGWGGEDDDLWRRIHSENMVVIRYSSAVSRYSMFKHDTDHLNEMNPIRHALLETSAKRMFNDGLNTIQYKRLGRQLTKLFLWVNVQVDEEKVWKNAPTEVLATMEKLP